MLFSERNGYKNNNNKVIQLESMNNELRTTLWNVMTLSYWNRNDRDYLSFDKSLEILIESLWMNYFKYSLDTLGSDWPSIHNKIKEYYFKCKWHEVYDFIEFVYNDFKLYDHRDVYDQFDTGRANQNIAQNLNIALRKENAGYSFSNGIFIPITNNEELSSIEYTIAENVEPVSKHIRRALELFSDRNNPDYRNSIKESISAVESVCKIISKNDKATLDDALKIINEMKKIHPAVVIAYQKLYAYTSDEGGIRHSLLENEKCDFDDAKYMLVICSAFINYIKGKIIRYGMNDRK